MEIQDGEFGNENIRNFSFFLFRNLDGITVNSFFFFLFKGSYICYINGWGVIGFQGLRIGRRRRKGLQQSFGK